MAAPAYGVVLRERTRYGAYVLRAAGAAPAPAFVEAADLTTVPSDPAVAAVQASVRPLLEALDADTRAEVAAATVFTTESVTAEMVALREAAAAAPPVVSAVEVVGPDAAALDALFGAQDPDATPGWLLGMTRPQPHGHIAAVVHGDIALPNFLAAEPNVAGRIEFDAAGAAVVKGTQSVRFTLVLPKTATDYANLPVVIYVHGINRTRIDMLVEADTAAARGMATLAIDAPYHGSRSSTAGDGRNDLTGDAVPDGFGDLEGLFPSVNFFHLVASGGVPAYHPAAMRDNLRQAAAEICALAAFVVSGDPSPIDAALVAAGLPGKLSFAPRVGILSESFGAMLATVALAVDPNLVAGSVWSIAAGFPYPAMLHSANFSGTFAGVVFSPFDVTARVALGDPIRGARFEPIVMLYDTAIERGDPLAFAPYLVAGSLRGGSGPHLMMTMSWGDEWVPNESHESMFAAAGVPRMPLAAPDSPPGDVLRFVSLPETGAAPVRGNLGGGRQTAAAVVWYPASHAAVRMLNDQFEFVSDQPPFERRAMPEPFDNPAAEAHAMWSRFLAEAVAGDVPSVIDPYAP
ncbi:MAG: hypothetical protein D6689_10080 [Deltaproteobacteria bacterium]|nr:MAG: hypothetical protein D6689_10080 [Deltaproteobacteria bacterium]